MSIAWKRADVLMLCGRCGDYIQRGAPARVTTLDGVRGKNREKWRCESCAGPAPPDLPGAIVASGPVTGGFQRATDALGSRTRGNLRAIARGVK